MAKELTAGFDISGQISEEVCTRIFQMAYWTGGIPDYVKKVNPVNTSELTEIFFEVPTLTFKDVAGLQNPVDINFRFVARLFPETLEIPGTAVATMDAIEFKHPDGSRNIVVNFASVPNNPSFDFDTFGSVPDAVLNRIKQLIAVTFSQKLKLLPISPLLKSEVGFFTFKTFSLDAASVHRNDQNRFLSIFVNKENVSAPPPGMISPTLFTSERLSYPSTTPKDQMRISVPREGIKPSLDAKIAEMNLPRVSPQDDSITINSLSIDLHDNYLKVTGNATKEVDVIWDPDIDFEIKMGLNISGGKLNAYVKAVNAELPWWAYSLHFLIPFVSASLIGAIKQAINKALSGAVLNLSEEALPLDLFSEENLPNTFGTVKVLTDGEVEIQQKGLILPAKVTTVFQPSPKKQIPYAFGHKDTKEFHNAECEYRKAMSRKNIVRLINPLDALRKAYNGCAWCYPQYNISDPGSLEIRLQDPANQTNFVGTIQAERSTAAIFSDLTAKPEFRIFSNFSLKDRHSWAELLPGDWKIKISSDEGWETAVDLNIPTGKHGVTYVTATRGKPNCNHAVGSIPPFP